MIFNYRIFLFVLAFGLPLNVPALDNSSGVKVTPLLKTTSTWNGQLIVYPAGQAEITGLLVEIMPGSETGWHEHSVPSFGMVLEGTLEVRLKSGEVKRLQSGDALAEVIDTLHNGRNVGQQPVKIVVFYAGAVGSPLTTKQSDQ
ncbi:Cupin_2 domain-containing protein [Gammaproteobacteria bacterium]